MTRETARNDGIALDRRTALKGGAAGLALLGLGGLGTGSVAADHEPANKTAAAGSTTEVFSSPEGESGSEIATLLEVPNVKTSGSEQDTLLFQPTVESSLFTRVESDGTNGNGKNKDKDDGSWDSIATAGVLGWIEIKGDETGDQWRYVSTDGHVAYDEPVPTDPSDLVNDGTLADAAANVVTFNSRDFKLEWDVQDLIDAVEELQDEVYEDDDEYTEEFDLLLDLYLRSRSAGGFNWIARGVNGVNDLRLRACLYDYTDGDAEARAVVGNRTMVVQSMKLPHDVE